MGEEKVKEIRDMLKSMKFEDWTPVDFEFAFFILSSDLYGIRDAMNNLNQSAKTTKDIQKCLDTISEILWEDRCFIVREKEWTKT